MRVVRRGDDDELNLRNRQQIINTAHNARVRIQLCRPVAAALHNRGKPQARDRMNHRRVKRASCQAKPDKSDIDHCSQEPSKFAEERTRICVRDVTCLAFNSKLPPASASFRMLEPMSTTTDVKRADNAISAAIPERTSSSRTGLLAVLFIGFILSGIATTIVGPMLPVFIRRWGLDDGQAGLFSTIQFLAALVGTGISGAWMAWRGYRPSLVAGYALIGYGLATLNASTHVNALAATAAFGLGYGLITPGTNLYVAEAGGARSASLLNLLNFTWGASAMACSPLFAMALRINRLAGLLIGYAIFGGLLAFALLFARFGSEKHEKPIAAAEGSPMSVGRGMTVAMATLFFIYVCMETSIGVWAAEYSRRITNGITNMTTLAPMFFYAGLTAGRGLAPKRP